MCRCLISCASRSIHYETWESIGCRPVGDLAVSFRAAMASGPRPEKFTSPSARTPELPGRFEAQLRWEAPQMKLDSSGHAIGVPEGYESFLARGEAGVRDGENPGWRPAHDDPFRGGYLPW